MQELFSCRNCIHNAGQSLHVGRGAGFCLKFGVLIHEPEDTTCKYQHRKDLPHFIVMESRSEHAAEFAAFTGLVSISQHEHRGWANYSEKFAWDSRKFDAVTNALATYHRSQKKWLFIQTFAGGIDGRRALVHSCLTRRYLDQCGTWTSSYRLVLSLVEEMKIAPVFDWRVLNMEEGDDRDETTHEASWDVFFARLTGLQEYGWHAGLENLMWASDSLNGALVSLDLEKLSSEIEVNCPKWTEEIIRHATDNGAYFTQGVESQGPQGDHDPFPS